MAAPPYFAFYPQDFASDLLVEAMSTLEVGAYILLLCKAWQADPPASLPNDDAVLARYARLDPHVWSEVKAGVLAPFVLGKDGRFHQKRLRREYEKVTARIVKNKRAGSLGGKARQESARQANALANARDSPSVRLASASPSVLGELNPKEKPEEGGGGPGAGDAEKAWFKHSLGVDPPHHSEKFFAAWSEWISYRRQRRLGKYTEIGLRGLATTLAGFPEDAVIAAIHTSMESNWKGIFPKKPADSKGNSTQDVVTRKLAEKGLK